MITGEMDTELLKRLLACDEGQFLEFKSAYATRNNCA